MSQLSLMKKWLAILLTVAMTSASADTIEPSTGEASSTSVEETKSVQWKARLFAGASLLAVIAGIVVICLDGGTSTSSHRDHHDHEHRHHHHCDPNQFDGQILGE